MARVGVAMMLHDRLKLAGTLAGVVFAILLSVQQLAILFGLVAKNTMFVDEAGADVWIAPRGTEWVLPGEPIEESALWVARTTPGVAAAEPLVMTNGALRTPEGRTEPVTLIGTALPLRLGGPWNVVAGDAGALASPDAIVLEDSQRERYGNVDLGAVREVNGRRVIASGFTWGLLPFAAPYAFAEIDTVRRLAGLDEDHTSFVLVTVHDGAAAERVRDELRGQLPHYDVLTASELHTRTVDYLLEAQLGASFATTVTTGVVIGLVIVALSMLSGVLDHLRELGTLKAIGCTNLDLTMLLIAQAIAYALLGDLVGLGLVSAMVGQIHSAELTAVLPYEVLLWSVPVTIALCVGASMLPVLRIRRLEPAMVFR